MAARSRSLPRSGRICVAVGEGMFAVLCAGSARRACEVCDRVSYAVASPCGRHARDGLSVVIMRVDGPLGMICDGGVGTEATAQVRPVVGLYILVASLNLYPRSR